MLYTKLSQDSSAKYYLKNKERLHKKTLQSCQNPFEIKRRLNGCQPYKSLPEHEKTKVGWV